MGRNAAFGRPQAHERLREWWYAKSSPTRNNIVLAVVVGAISVALIMAATSGDAARTSPRVNANRPSVTLAPAVTTTSTTLLGSLFAAVEPSTSTTTSTVAVATTVTSAPPVRSSPPPAPATTVPTPDVIVTEVPAPVPTTPPVTTPPVTTTAPPTTVPPVTTTRPATTTPPTTAAVRLSPLLGSG